MTTPGESERRSRLGSVGSGAKSTGRGLRSVGRGAGKVGGAALRTARRAAAAEGADSSGLARLIELGALNAAADAAVAISLAGTLFFQVPTGEARGQVSLFLALTMLPFAIVAPLVGPMLDRFGHGRRWSIGATMAGAGLPLLGDGRLGRSTGRRGCSRRPSASWSPPRPTT